MGLGMRLGEGRWVGAASELDQVLLSFPLEQLTGL